MSGFRAFLLLLGCLLSACLTSPPANEGALSRESWSYDHLQQLDPVDSSSPHQDLIALYSRIVGHDLQIRIDLLDLVADSPVDVYIALDLVPGGSRMLPLETRAGLEFDLLVELKGSLPPRALDSNLEPVPELLPRLVREPDLDTLTISLNRRSLPADLRQARIQAFASPVDDAMPADSLGPVLLFGEARPPQAPLILIFWNAFQARTPAQALRRWDGAHTGPFGERHGLRNLLSASGTTGVPVTLLDLKSSASLAALDFLGVLPIVQPLVQGGLVTLPDAVPVTHTGMLPFLPPPEGLDAGIRLGRQAGLAFGLPASSILYAPLVPGDLSSYRLLIVPASSPATPQADSQAQPVGSAPIAGAAAEDAAMPGPRQTASSGIGIASLARSQGRLIFEIPALHPLPQATDEGLPAGILEALLGLALSSEAAGRPGGDRFFVLGGDLTASAWGDPRAARSTLRYIAAHPWLRPLKPADLLTFPAVHAARPPEPRTLLSQVPFNTQGQPIASGLTVKELAGVFWRQIASLEDEHYQPLAIESYFSLLAPNPPEDGRLPALRADYLGQLGGLLGALQAVGGMSPGEVDCSADPDLDGEAECLLRSEDMVLVIERSGAHVTHALARTPDGWRQWIAPYAQFISGFGDPEAWVLKAGPSGDPASVPGGFSDSVDTWLSYWPSILPNGIHFESSDGRRIKTFEWTAEGLRVTYEGPAIVEITARVPLALAAGSSGTPGWASGYRLENTGQGLVWGRQGEFRIEIKSDQPTRIAAYRAGTEPIRFPEDPNFDYPPGHFLPLQITLLEIIGSGHWEILFRVLPP